MGSILERANLNKIYLIYGHLDDMFISRNLQKDNFRPFFNGYLKNIVFEQIVFYSGDKNVGKFVMDDESAMLAINKNKKLRSNSPDAGSSEEKPRKKRRILNPRGNAESDRTASGAGSNTEPKSNVDAGEDNTKIIYKQPKITPVEFLEDAKKIMADSSHKSAIVFTFFQDFFTDRSAPLQPYLE